ncbi:hypothetical protein HN935_03685 [archaeon]|jgi:hypothetical protein|nr:hypothetical protein [archaeon]
MWKSDFIEAKYHLAVAERMMAGYAEYPEKRFLIGVINEAARAVSRLIRSFMIYDEVKGGLNDFLKRVAPKYLDAVTCEHLVKVLEIERAQKESPIEFARGDKIILLIRGKYRFLTASRIGEFVRSAKCAVSAFPVDFRQV